VKYQKMKKHELIERFNELCSFDHVNLEHRLSD